MPTEYPRYHVHGLVARVATLTALGLDGAKVLPLRFGLGLLPLTDELATGEPQSVEFAHLTARVVELAVAASARGPVAYIEAESADGAGYHAAIGWRDGARAYGPFHREDRSPVNDALRRLGVTPDPGADEFTTLGLASLC